MTCGLGCCTFEGSDSVVDSLLTVAPDVGSEFVLWFAMHCFVSFLGFINLDVGECYKYVAKETWLKSICIFTDHSMAVLLLWIFFVTYASCLSCYLVVNLLQSCGHLLGKGWPLRSLVCGDLLCFITSQWGVLGQMWYLSASVADLCILSFFKEWK